MSGSIDMMMQRRMSPWTALMLGLSAVGVIGIVCTAGVLLYVMRVADRQASSVLGVVGHAVDGLPELIGSLPPAVADALRDRRAPAYARSLSVVTDYVLAGERRGVIPVATIENKGDELVTMLGLRVVALDARGRPIREWTQVVATPVTIDDDWRGPLAPGATRRVLLSRYGRWALDRDAIASTEYEITDVRVWDPDAVVGGDAS
ncbi:MAG: hypothetical protein ACE5E6_02390 [Phycisphaerae bacterium]